MIFCKYKNMFGKPREGLHSTRIFGMAAVDLIGTLIGGYVIANFMKWNVLYTILGFLVIGEMFHYLFCVDTAVIKLVKS